MSSRASPRASIKQAPEISPDGKTKKYKISGSDFVVPARYDVLRFLGAGAYGTVCAAFDNEANTRVAIKKARDVFGEPLCGKRILREIKVLSTIRHSNVLRLRSVLPVDPATFQDVYMVLDLWDADLQYIINSPQPIVEAHVKYFLVQILRALKFVHSANIVHRDIKPGNILVNTKSAIAITDFGLARTVDDQSLSRHVATRWYRAPELLVLNSHYNFPVDIWATGCVLGEVLRRKALFRGSSYLDQLHLIIDVLGTPSEEDLGDSSDEAKRYVLNNIPRREKVPWERLLPDAPPAALELLDWMLKFDARKRPTAAQALEHPFIQRHRRASDEPLSEHKYYFELEETNFTERTLRAAFVELINDVNNGTHNPFTPLSGTASHQESLASEESLPPIQARAESSIMFGGDASPSQPELGAAPRPTGHPPLE